MAIEFYQETNGDYLCIDTELKNRAGAYEGRASAISRLPTSVCSTGIVRSYLNRCKRVIRGAVPQEWLCRLDPDGSSESQAVLHNQNANERRE